MKFHTGDSVKTNAASKDHVMGLGAWRAVIIKVKNPPAGRDVGGCYETVGWFEAQLAQKKPGKPTLRQLWGEHLDADTTEDRITSQTIQS